MLVRIGLVMVVLFFSIIAQSYKGKNKLMYSFFMLLLGITLIIPFVYRDVFFPYSLIGDYENYVNRFQYMTVQRAIKSIQDLGFNLLIVLCRTICKDFRFFAFICIAFIVISLLRFLEENSNDFTVSVIIYVCLMYLSAFNILRQWLACAFCMIAFKYIKQQNVKKFVIIVMIAMLFHFSALIYLVLYPLLNIKADLKKKTIFMALTGGVVYVFNKYLLLIMIFFSNKMGTAYGTRYMDSVGLSADKVNYTVSIISVLLFVALTMVLRRIGFEKDEKLIYTYVAACCLFALLGPINTVFSRLVVYFLPSFLIGFPLVEKIIKRNASLPIYKLIIGGLVISAFCL